MFGTKDYLADDDLIDRYSSYLSRIMMKGSDPFMAAKYKQWQEQREQSDPQSQQLTFYERMKIDEVVRLKNVKPGDANTGERGSKGEGQGQESDSNEETDDDQDMPSDPQEVLSRQEEKRVRKMAKHLGISTKEARYIRNLIKSKNIQSKLLDAESEDEELGMDPSIAGAAAEAARQVQEMGSRDPAAVRQLLHRKVTIDLDDDDQITEIPTSRKSPAGKNASKEKSPRKKTFRLKNLISGPGQYMQDLINDEVFDQWIQ